MMDASTFFTIAAVIAALNGVFHLSKSNFGKHEKIHFLASMIAYVICLLAYIASLA